MNFKVNIIESNEIKTLKEIESYLWSFNLNKKENTEHILGPINFSDHIACDIYEIDDQLEEHSIDLLTIPNSKIKIFFRIFLSKKIDYVNLLCSLSCSSFFEEKMFINLPKDKLINNLNNVLLMHSSITYQNISKEKIINESENIYKKTEYNSNITEVFCKILNNKGIQEKEAFILKNIVEIFNSNVFIFKKSDIEKQIDVTNYGEIIKLNIKEKEEIGIKAIGEDSKEVILVLLESIEKRITEKFLEETKQKYHRSKN